MGFGHKAVGFGSKAAQRFFESLCFNQCHNGRYLPLGAETQLRSSKKQNARGVQKEFGGTSQQEACSLPVELGEIREQCATLSPPCASMCLNKGLN